MPNISSTVNQTYSYYDMFRSDIISVVPDSAKCVLSVGCAAGKTEAELVKRGVKVVGVEINHEAAAIARQRGLIILEGDTSEVDIGLASESYDCLIYADVLEHLRDPAAVIKRHVSRLRPNGTVIISVPNFRHYSVFWQLFILGHIRYTDAGILDRTHLRITTRRAVANWCREAGIEPINCKYPLGNKWKLLSILLFGLFEEFIAKQVIIVGRKLRSRND